MNLLSKELKIQKRANFVFGPISDTTWAIAMNNISF